MGSKPLLTTAVNVKGDRGTRSNRGQWTDASYLPVYSEAKAENERRAGRGQRANSIPSFIWARTQNISGQDSFTDMMEYTMKGYLPVTEEVLARYGYGVPPSATKMPDGTYRRQDTALFYVDAETADMNRADAEYLRKEAQNGSAVGDGIEVLEGSRRRGSLEDFQTTESN